MLGLEDIDFLDHLLWRLVGYHRAVKSQVEGGYAVQVVRILKVFFSDGVIALVFVMNKWVRDAVAAALLIETQRVPSSSRFDLYHLALSSRRALRKTLLRN